MKTGFFICLLLCTTQSFAAVWSITYPRPIDDTDKRHEYPLEVLKIALDQTGVRYELLPSDRILLQAEALRALQDKRLIDVLWSMTNKQREEELLPIRIPLTKGLIGWRVSLVHKDSIPRFSRVANLRDLQEFTAVQGRDWPDTKILQANGFSVRGVTEYQDANKTLIRRQSDFFPRSVNEVLNELDALGIGSEIGLEPNFIIQYPAAQYLFVNKNNVTLARLIETGLRGAIESGEFDKLFIDTFTSSIDELNLKQRQIFRLSNPLLPEETPLSETNLWFDIR